MYDDQGRGPFSPLLLIIIFIIAIVAVIGVTVALNGGSSSPTVVENESNNTNGSVENTSFVSSMIGNNSYGRVDKITGLGNSSSDIRIALIVGVDDNGSSPNSVVSSVEENKDLKYSYDIYIVNTTSTNQSDDTQNNSNNMSSNNMSEQLAAEYVVPDVVTNNYNFTVDVHSTDDSNPFVFVPVNTTYTSKKVIKAISDEAGIGEYTPSNHGYTESISEPIISYEIPSIVYVSREYHQNSSSPEVTSVIKAIDNFDFKKLFDTNQTADENNTNSSDTNKTSNTTKDYNQSKSSNSDSYSSNNFSYKSSSKEY